MNNQEISNARLSSQKIINSELKSPSEVVSWMGAMQAQDFLMSKWAIGLRYKGADIHKVDESINNGKILRIHILRPTWHFVSSNDIYWMLDLSASKIISSLKGRHKELELSESIISRTQLIIENRLTGNRSMTREELAEEFNKVKIRTDANRLSHILFCAEMVGLVCSGPQTGGKLTYSLLQERVPVRHSLSREEALAELAKRYFTSRCPATLEDFIWWSNLSVSAARASVELIKPDFISETYRQNTYILPGSFRGVAKMKHNLQLLPAYDEYLISYRDRSSSLSLIHNKKTISDNGIFYPAIVADGQVSGVWKREIKRDKATITARFFMSPDEKVYPILNKKCTAYGKFLGKEPVLQFNTETL